MKEAGVHILPSLLIPRGIGGTLPVSGSLNLFFKYVRFCMEANPLGTVGGITKPRTALGFPTIDIRLSGSVVVPSSTAFSFPMKIFPLKAHFGLAPPFPNGRSRVHFHDFVPMNAVVRATTGNAN